jgi:hypothetical protein
MKVMKTWLSKFRISCALDETGLERGTASLGDREREGLRHYRASVEELDWRLRTARPADSVPVGLHHSIMRSVRRVAGGGGRRPSPVRLRWLPAPALALLIVGGVWWALNRPEDGSQSLVTAAAALEQGRQLTHQAPSAALAPLSQELENLNRDFRKAVEVLIASVP